MKGEAALVEGVGCAGDDGSDAKLLVDGEWGPNDTPVASLNDICVDDDAF